MNPTLDKNNDIYKNYSDLIEIAGVILIVLDRDHKISMINKKGCEILGYDRDEILGKQWFDNFMYEESIKDTKIIFEHLMQGNIQPAEYFENPIKTKNGKRYILWHNSIIRDDYNNISGILSSGEDITSHKLLIDKIEEQASMFRAAFKISPIATSFIDQDGIVSDVNDECVKMHGKNLIGSHFSKFIYEKDLPQTFGCIEMAKKFNLPQRLKNRHVHADGSIILCDSTITYISRNGASHFISQSLDITDRENTKLIILETLDGLKEIAHRNS